MFFVELSIVSLITHIVVIVQSLLQFVSVNTKFLSQLFNGICADESVISFFLRTVKLSINCQECIFRMNDIKDIRAIFLVVFQDFSIHDAVSVISRLKCQRITCVSCVTHHALVHETVTVLVDQKVWLTKNCV